MDVDLMDLPVLLSQTLRSTSVVPVNVRPSSFKTRGLLGMSKWTSFLLSLEEAMQTSLIVETAFFALPLYRREPRSYFFSTPQFSLTIFRNQWLC
jgi:hypothetical protein